MKSSTEQSLEKVAITMSENHSVVLFGDYNLNDIHWGFENGSSIATILNKNNISEQKCVLVNTGMVNVFAVVR